MALQGTLRDFNITEIIQLIGQQLKTGILKIQKGKKVAEISFLDGMIIHVYSNYRGKKDLIGEIFVRAQFITEKQLEQALKIQKETLQYLGEILVELQFLTENDVVKVITAQTYETIYDLFWWEEGAFYFDLKLVESYQKIPFSLSTEQVLLNIIRMMDEWSEIEKKLYSPHLVFKKKQGEKGVSNDVLLSESDSKEKLAIEQELIYNLIDGSRTVQEIIDRSLLGKFIASEILVNQLDMGRIETIGIRAPSFMEKMGLPKFGEALAYLYYGALLLFLILFLVFYKPGVLRQVMNSGIERVTLAKPTHFIQQTQMSRIETALEIYYMEKGTYPFHLEELISAKLVQQSDLFYRQGVSYQYGLKDGKYFLRH
jgi:hypothetical protein